VSAEGVGAPPGGRYGCVGEGVGFCSVE